MSRRVAIRPLARQDLRQIAEFLAEKSLPAAERFLDAAERTFAILLQAPEMGSLCSFPHPEAEAVRWWTLRRFRNYVIFYRPTRSGIDIVRVLHGARDLESLFAPDTSP